MPRALYSCDLLLKLPVLWIAKKRLGVVETSSGSIETSCADGPRAEELSLGPSFREGEERRVDQAADRHFREVGQEVVERHPRTIVILAIFTSRRLVAFIILIQFRYKLKSGTNKNVFQEWWSSL